MLKAGDRIGDWVVDSVLGEGGMGAVYRVHSALTDRHEAALTVMKPTIAEDARRRFVREAEALSALRHPAIVRVMGFSEDPARGLLYLVMELATGETLKDRLARGPMPLPEALRTFVPLASALDHAHQEGIFHRDLKPANVVLTDDGTPRLVDFGIAVDSEGHTLTGEGQMGTLAYLPPEVFRGLAAEPGGIDVYAFGLLLHEALTGQRTYSVEPGLTPAAAAAAVGVRKLRQPRQELPPAFPQPLRDMVAAATDPDPAKRPSMRKLRETLQSLVDRRAGAAMSASAAAAAAARTPVSPYVAAPAAPPRPAARPATADRTMRVPDPPPPPLGQRLADASRGRRGIIAGGVIALLVAVGLALAFAGRDRRHEEPSRKVDAPVAPAQAIPAATVPPSTMAALPSPRPLPSSTPLTSAAPSHAPSPVISISPAVAPRTPPPSTPAAPVIVRPEVTGEEPPAEEAPVERISPSPATGGDVSGRWELSNRIVTTDYDAYRGLNLGYRLTLRQDGRRVTGTGVKVSENGSPVGRPTPIRVTGRIEGSTVMLSFTEEGTERTSAGTFRWQLSPDGSSLRGSFFSDAANTNGPSSARRVQ